jgi:ABC-type transporter Mla MlaB component
VPGRGSRAIPDETSAPAFPSGAACHESDGDERPPDPQPFTPDHVRMLRVVTPGPFTVNVHWQGRSATFRCRGTLDETTMERFGDALDLCLERQPRLLCLDLTEMVVVGSVGLRALDALVRACREREVDLDLRLT